MHYTRPMRKLGLAIIVLILFFVFTNSANAQQTETQMPTPSITPDKTDYDLAYPGILPDNSLYKLKVLRDKISIMLIADHYKRIEFYLLQADKGILATAMLIDKNKIKLAEETALKAEHNMTLITFELKSLEEKPSKELFDKLKTASQKHQEVLNTLIGRLTPEDQKVLTTVLNFSKTNLQTIEKLQNKKYYNK